MYNSVVHENNSTVCWYEITRKENIQQVVLLTVHSHEIYVKDFDGIWAMCIPVGKTGFVVTWFCYYQTQFFPPLNCYQLMNSSSTCISCCSSMDMIYTLIIWLVWALSSIKFFVYQNTYFYWCLFSNWVSISFTSFQILIRYY